MYSKAYDIKKSALILLSGALLLCGACATAPTPAPAPTRARTPTPPPKETKVHPPAPQPQAPAPHEAREEGVPAPPAPSGRRADPRSVAALELVDEGRLLLEGGRPDEAIQLLERALTLNPADGRACYYLAEAWLLKGNPRQAAAFNRLAEIHLPPEGQWPQRLRRQKELIAGR